MILKFLLSLSKVIFMVQVIYSLVSKIGNSCKYKVVVGVVDW